MPQVDAEKSAIRKLLVLTESVVGSINPDNAERISKLVDTFSAEFQKVVLSPSMNSLAQPIWKQFPSMTEAQIVSEFSDEQKYPDVESIKRAVKGYVDLNKAGKVKTRETLIKHILNTYHRGSFISG